MNYLKRPTAAIGARTNCHEEAKQLIRPKIYVNYSQAEKCLYTTSIGDTLVSINTTTNF
jgi:hypothetical protein